MTRFEKIMESSRFCATNYSANCDRCMYGDAMLHGDNCYCLLHKAGADAIEELWKVQARKPANDVEFMSYIIKVICDYAVENGMEPNHTLKTVADNIHNILEISTFNNWKPTKGKE